MSEERSHVFAIRGENNHVLLWNKERAEYEECRTPIRGLVVAGNADNCTVKIKDAELFGRVILHLEGHNHTISFGEAERGRKKCLNALIFVTYNDGTLEIGDNVRSAADFLLCIDEPYAHCSIGNDVTIDDGVILYASDAHPVMCKKTGEVLNYGKGKRCLTVGGYSHIGSGALLLKSAVIAPNTEVYPGTWVNQRFEEEHTCLAGHPARIIERDS